MKRYSMLMDGKLNIAKMSVLPNLICRFNAIKSLPNYFVNIDSKVYRERQKTQKGQQKLKEIQKVEGLTLLNFKPYYKAKVMKTVYYQ